MAPLQRHQLVWLDAATWRRVLAAPADTAWDLQALECLQHWAAQGLPLVVTRQPQGGSGRCADDALVLGLAAPACWGRRRLFVDARLADVRRQGHFPLARDITPSLAPDRRDDWTALCAELDAIGATARVYGSHGWQQLSGLACLHAGSDIDLLVAVGSAHQADAVVKRLNKYPFSTPRIDGELAFAEGDAVAWREWAAWRAGSTVQMLVKRLHGATLESCLAWDATA